MKIKFKTLVLTLVMVFVFGITFTAKAEESLNTIFCDALGKQTTKDVCDVASSQQPGSNIIFCDVLGKQTTKDVCDVASSQQSGSNTIFCNVLGKQTTKDQCDASNGQQQPQQDQQQNNNQPNNQFGSQPMNSSAGGGQNGGQGNGPGNGQNGGPSLKDMQREGKNIERELTAVLKTLTKAGVTLPDSVAEIKTALASIKSATDVSTLEDVNIGDLHGTMGELRQLANDTQRLSDIKRNLKSMNQQLASFEKQLAKLTKQNIAIPADIADQISKLKTTLAAINDAKTADEVSAAGADDLQSMFQDLNDTRQQLDMLARWPQAAKQMDQQVTALDRQLKKSKTIVGRLISKGIDLNTQYTAFEDAVNKLKAVRDDAKQKMATGDGQGAFDAVQNDFFGQMDETMQYQAVIDAMNNLGQFNAQFKRDNNSAEQQIKSLAKKKIDIAELRSILDDAKAKGVEATALLKGGNVNVDDIQAIFDELQQLRVDFGNKVDELTGNSDNQVWQQGPAPQQFQQMKVNQQVKQVSVILHPPVVAGVKIIK